MAVPGSPNPFLVQVAKPTRTTLPSLYRAMRQNGPRLQGTSGLKYEKVPSLKTGKQVTT